jgi:hypothetical protein
MNCCIDCFSDNQIRQIIDSFNQNGDCDFCSKKDVRIYTITGNGGIEDLLDSVVDIYTKAGFSGKTLNVALCEDWDIFAVSPDIINELLKALCAVRFGKDPHLFSSPVLIPECFDDAYLSEFCITRNKGWRQFSEALKYQNRFYNSIFNPDALASFVSYSVKHYPSGTVMYRARISKDKHGFLPNEMGAPPRDKRAAGRVNPEGVEVLYLSSKDITALYEVRSNLYDYVTIGEFKLLRDIRIVNLAGISVVSPFIYAATNDLQQYAVNQKCLKEIAEDIGKPLRRNDSQLEYLPTQIIAEFIKSQGYDGVEYSSTMTKDGYNLAIFSECLFECTQTRVYEIAELIYKHREAL